MAQETVNINFKDKIITLKFEEFDSEIDVDELCKIDYSNLHAEFVTIAALMNKVGIWKAESENDHDLAKLNMKITEAQKADHYRKSLVREDTYANGNPKTVHPSNDEVDQAVAKDPIVQKYQKKTIRLKKEAAYMDSLYWAIKSKEKKLDKLIEGMNITPEDFQKELVEGKWNGILIKLNDKLIK